MQRRITATKECKTWNLDGKIKSDEHQLKRANATQAGNHTRI